MSLLQMSFFASVIIIAIIIIRSVTLNKLPKKMFIILWYIALVRLLIPFEVESSLSVYSLVDQDTPIIVPMISTVTPPVLPAETIVSESSTSPVIAPETSASAVLPPKTTVPALVPETRSISPKTTSVVNHNLDLSHLFTIIWLAGMIFCALFFLISYIRCYREFQMSFPVKNEYINSWLEGHKLRRVITVRQSGRVSSPLTYGFFRPVILMPKKMDWQDAKSLNYILEHEFIHIKRFDAVTKILFILPLCLHWFNPLVWVMYILVNRDIELSCDDTVIRSLGDANKSSYAHTLIDMEEKANWLSPLYNNFSKNAIEERITAIMKIKKISLVTIILSVLLVVSVATAFATTAKAHKPILPITELTEVTTEKSPSAIHVNATSTTEARSYKIGDIGHAGGVIFYIDGNTYYECSNLLGEATWDNAFTLAENYQGGGYNDWYLPNKEELSYIYANLRPMGKFYEDEKRLWSASEDGNGHAWSQLADSPPNHPRYAWRKGNSLGVVAVRSFSSDEYENMSVADFSDLADNENNALLVSDTRDGDNTTILADDLTNEQKDSFLNKSYEDNRIDFLAVLFSR